MPYDLFSDVQKSVLDHSVEDCDDSSTLGVGAVSEDERAKVLDAKGIGRLTTEDVGEGRNTGLDLKLFGQSNDHGAIDCVSRRRWHVGSLFVFRRHQYSAELWSIDGTCRGPLGGPCLDVLRVAPSA